MIHTIEPFAVPAVSLAEAKSWLRVEHDAENALIESLVAAGTREVENYTHRPIELQKFRQYLVGFYSDLTLERWPVKAITKISYYASDVWNDLGAAYYFFEPGSRPTRIRLARSYSWPSVGFDRFPVQVEFTAETDNDETRQQLKTGVLMYVGHYYENRQAQPIPEGFYHFLSPLRVILGV